MKKIKLLFVLFLLLGLSFMFACGDNPTNDPEDPEQGEVSEKEFTVTFSDGVASQKVKEGEKATKPADPVKDGYVFKGWFVNDTLYDFNSAVTADVTLTAKWEEVKELNKYTIKFYINDELVKEEVVEEGKSATAPEPKEIEGAIFVKWDGNYNNVTSDATVKAVYVYDSFNVEFIVDGKKYGEDQLVEYGKDATMPADPEKDGYVFKGWDKEAKAVKENLVLTAIFEVVNYNIKFYNGEEELTGDNYPKTYTVEDEVSLPSFVLDGYTFVGWYDNAELNGDACKVISKGSTEDKVFYALNIKFELNGGALSWTTTVPTDFAAGDGIDGISDLPETFEKDFFKYLKDNNLLTDSRVNESCQAATWEKFSGLNPNHNGDPKRIWNDTSTNSSKGADGYVALFLFDKITMDENNVVTAIEGGFLGTEPYKTKYQGLTQVLALLHTYRVTSSSKYTPITNNTASTRALTGFVIDGYFYGTQGAGEGYFAKLRNIIPGVDFGYVLDGTDIMKVDYKNTLPSPVKDDFVFNGWYLDSELTTAYDGNKLVNKTILYAKWEEIK